MSEKNEPARTLNQQILKVAAKCDATTTSPIEGKDTTPRLMGPMEREQVKEYFDKLFLYEPQNKAASEWWLEELGDVVQDIHEDAKAWQLGQLKQWAEDAIHAKRWKEKIAALAQKGGFKNHVKR